MIHYGKISVGSNNKIQFDYEFCIRTESSPLSQNYYKFFSNLFPSFKFLEQLLFGLTLMLLHIHCVAYRSNTLQVLRNNRVGTGHTSDKPGTYPSHIALLVFLNLHSKNHLNFVFVQTFIFCTYSIFYNVTSFTRTFLENQNRPKRKKNFRHRNS